MSVSEFIEANKDLPIEDLLVRYAGYRLDNLETQIPYDIDIWLEANRLSEIEFCKWFMDERYNERL